MSSAEARELIAAARVARFASVRPDGAPSLVPVVLAVLDDVIIFAVDAKPKTTLDLQRLRNIGHEPRVTFLVDEYDDDWARLWWARADAVAEVLQPDHPDWPAVVAALTVKYAQYVNAPPIGPAVRARVHRWSGWRAALRPGPAPRASG